MPTLDTDLFIEYVDLHNEKKDLEEKLADVKAAMAKKEKFLKDALVDNQMEKISIAGKTCYTKVNRFAVIKDKKEAIEVLKEAGFEEFVAENYNTQSISKLVRDQMDENGRLPDAFGDVITMGKSVVIGVNGS